MSWARARALRQRMQCPTAKPHVNLHICRYLEFRHTGGQGHLPRRTMHHLTAAHPSPIPSPTPPVPSLGTLVGAARLSGCAMPDSLRWTPDGKRLVVACEGEPATQATAGSDPRVEPNPVGAIGIVAVSWCVVCCTPCFG